MCICITEYVLFIRKTEADLMEKKHLPVFQKRRFEANTSITSLFKKKNEINNFRETHLDNEIKLDTHEVNPLGSPGCDVMSPTGAAALHETSHSRTEVLAWRDLDKIQFGAY